MKCTCQTKNHQERKKVAIHPFFLSCLTARESVKEGIYPGRDVFPESIYPKPEKLSRKYLYALPSDR
jgi:hypothetical protein